MDQVKKIKVDGVTFNVMQAPAAKQKTLLTLMGPKITINAKTSGSQINLEFLRGALISTPEDVLDQVSDIVLEYVADPKQPEVPVDVGMFQGRMFSYLTLLAECLRVNLDDFFTWLNNANKAATPEDDKQ